MKILQINSVYGVRSTGRIVYELEMLQSKSGIKPYIVSGEGFADSPHVHIMSGKLYLKANILMTRLFGKHGFYSRLATRRMLRFVDKASPDIIHLHNIHGHYFNVRMIFEYIQKHNIPVVWTLHDCWAFTGHCPHFDYIGCDKWRTGCGACPQRRGYPDSWFFDRSRGNFKIKEKIFTATQNMHIVTPSDWLSSLARQSFLGKYPVTTIHNGIDTDVFSPCESDFKKRYGLEDKFVILGIVSNLNSTKGGQYFLELAKLLSEDEHIVLLSLEQGVDLLPHNITAIGRTDNAYELAQVYSGSDVFVNPTLQDTFPTVNLEALSCGVPVVTFDTGGSPEAVTKDSGAVAKKGDIRELYQGIQRVRKGEFSAEKCRARGLRFSAERCFSEYIDLYNKIIK
ncbi:MAG: glycosyltransferase [Ruminococcus sp.]|nr:glycosyltransferase [Ruminococcus sp.]